MGKIEQRVDFVPCHHEEEPNALMTYSNMDATNKLINDKLEVLDAKGFEVTSVVPVISGRGIYGQEPYEIPRENANFVTSFMNYFGNSRKAKKAKKQQVAATTGAGLLPFSFGYSYTQGFNIFSSKKNA